MSKRPVKLAIQWGERWRVYTDDYTLQESVDKRVVGRARIVCADMAACDTLRQAFGFKDNLTFYHEVGDGLPLAAWPGGVDHWGPVEILQGIYTQAITFVILPGPDGSLPSTAGCQLGDDERYAAKSYLAEEFHQAFILSANADCNPEGCVSFMEVLDAKTIVEAEAEIVRQIDGDDTLRDVELLVVTRSFVFNYDQYVLDHPRPVDDTQATSCCQDGVKSEEKS